MSYERVHAREAAKYGCRNTFRTYTLGGESAVMSEHRASQVFGGDCSCYLEYEARLNDAQSAGPIAYYRFLRAEYGWPAQRAWDEARTVPAPPSYTATLATSPLWKYGSAWDDDADIPF